MHSLINGFSKPSSGGEPVYLQIVRQFKLLMLQGRLKNGDEIPSRRLLAAQLSVNPNTVQKAFVELEKDGLIKTPPNAKSVVLANEAVLARLREELLEAQINTMVAVAKSAGLSYEQLVHLIYVDWSKEE